MKNQATAVAYPTIPLVFNSCVHPDRIPVHHTMGIAVTDTEDKVRTETVVRMEKGYNRVEFFFDGKKLEPDKMRDLNKIISEFRKRAGVKEKTGFRIESRNYDIYSGSSDSGAAALVFALQEVLGTDFSLEELAKISMIISETSIRSVYGGVNEIDVDEYPKFFGNMVASSKDLEDVRIFALTFDYDMRVTAAQIFDACGEHPEYKCRLERVPKWVKDIKEGLASRDWHKVFTAAEENCANAHYLIESSRRGLRCRKKEMMNACIDVEEIRAMGLPCYWTAGGGRVVNVFSWGKDAEKVERELVKRGYKPTEYKVASGPKIIG
jgi:mevalonate pyrophosphate decarboxylase